MLHPSDAKEDSEAVFVTEIEKPTGRGRVDPDQISPGFGNNFQILGSLVDGTVLESLRIRCERTIGYPFDKKFLFPLEEKLRA
jgi:hypothetical protein